MKRYQVWFKPATNGKSAQYALLSEKNLDLFEAVPQAQMIHEFSAPGQNDAQRIFEVKKAHHQKMISGKMGIPFRHRRR